MEVSGLDISHEPTALKLPSAQGEPGETPGEGSTSRVDIGAEKLQDGASGRTRPGSGKMSRQGSSNFTLLGEVGL